MEEVYIRAERDRFSREFHSRASKSVPSACLLVKFKRPRATCIRDVSRHAAAPAANTYIRGTAGRFAEPPFSEQPSATAVAAVNRRHRAFCDRCRTLSYIAGDIDRMARNARLAQKYLRL